ncbi:MAG: cyclic nucleotide-binding domain-containing protein [Proteobacteria bacterium]|nr:cyclic nucleotide-binding domain-containing protein [Pseudomonadota bacterium]
MAGEKNILDRRTVPKGHVIIHEGEKGSNAFLIQSGRARVYVTDKEGRKADVGVLDPGQIFGEMALVFDGPRTATVEAMEETNLILITRETLRQKLEKSDPTVKALVPMLMKRIVQANETALKKSGDVSALIDVTAAIYQNIEAGLSVQEKSSLKRDVEPKLQEFLVAAKAFSQRGGK